MLIIIIIVFYGCDECHHIERLPIHYYYIINPEQKVTKSRWRVVPPPSDAASSSSRDSTSTRCDSPLVGEDSTLSTQVEMLDIPGSTPQTVYIFRRLFIMQQTTGEEAGQQIALVVVCYCYWFHAI